MTPELSQDGLATLLLCSELGLPRNPEPGHSPLSLKEWNEIAPRIASSPLESPAGFMREDSSAWMAELGLSEGLAARIRNLLERKANLAIELERLSSLGIWVVTRADEAYPCRLKKVLGRRSPTVLFGAGDPSILGMDGIAAVGSRDVDQAGLDFAYRLGTLCVRQGLALISGGARGVDQAAQRGAFEAGGHVISISAQGLETLIRSKDVREAIFSEHLVVLSAAHPRSPFNVGQAMGRNKYIYALSLAAVVVASSVGKGGTWAGAEENLKHGWVPTLVRSGEGVPEGNRRLLKAGATPLGNEALEEGLDLRTLAVQDTAKAPSDPVQETLEVQEPEPVYLEEGPVSKPDVAQRQETEPFTYTRKSLLEVVGASTYRAEKAIKALRLKEEPAMFDGSKYSEAALQSLRDHIEELDKASYPYTKKNLSEALSITTSRLDGPIKKLGLKDDTAMFDGKKYSERALQTLRDAIGGGSTTGEQLSIV